MIKKLFLLSVVVLFAACSTFAYASNYVEAHSYWKLNGNALDSNGSNNGTVSGATVTTGKYGKHIFLTGQMITSAGLMQGVRPGLAREL